MSLARLRAGAGRVAYVARHLFLVWLMLALLSANLYVEKPAAGDPWPARLADAVDGLLQPWTGLWLERAGLRQYWAMFSPNPTHYGALVDAVVIDATGERRVELSEEPPALGAFVMFGYDRIGKFHKKVYLEKGRFAAPYVQALCRIHGFDGRVRLLAAHRYTPSPSRRLSGWAPMRVEEVLGEWKCRS